MQNMLCSIIIPVFNVEDFLDKCIQTAIDQTHKNLEIILVDDGSTDSSGEKCDKWKLKDKRVYVFHKSNGGLSDARNFGLKKAHGEFILFIDSDDYIDSTMCEKLLRKMIEDDSHLCLCGINYVYENGKILHLNEINLKNVNSKNILEYYTLSGKRIKNSEIITENIMGSVCRVLYRYSYIKNHLFEFGMFCEDLIFNVSLIEHNTKISVIDEALYFYYQRQGSILHSFNVEKYKKRVNFSKKVISLLNGKVKENILSAYKFQLYLVLLNELCVHGDKKLMSEFINSRFFKLLNTKTNYKNKQKNTKLLKYKIANFLAYHKLFLIYLFLIKILKK